MSDLTPETEAKIRTLLTGYGFDQEFVDDALGYTRRNEQPDTPKSDPFVSDHNIYQEDRGGVPLRWTRGLLARHAPTMTWIVANRWVISDYEVEYAMEKPSRVPWPTRLLAYVVVFHLRREARKRVPAP